MAVVIVVVVVVGDKCKVRYLAVLRSDKMGCLCKLIIR